MGQYVQVAAFDVRRGFARIGGDIVDVYLQGVGAGVLQIATVLDPAGFTDTVEAGNHGNVQMGFQRLQLLEVLVEA